MRHILRSFLPQQETISEYSLKDMCMCNTLQSYPSPGDFTYFPQTQLYPTKPNLCRQHFRITMGIVQVVFYFKICAVWKQLNLVICSLGSMLSKNLLKIQMKQILHRSCSPSSASLSSSLYPLPRSCFFSLFFHSSLFSVSVASPFEYQTSSATGLMSYLHWIMPFPCIVKGIK